MNTHNKMKMANILSDLDSLKILLFFLSIFAQKFAVVKLDVMRYTR